MASLCADVSLGNYSFTLVECVYWQVKELATVSLSNPVKVFVNENKDIAFNLQQEFIRIRPHMEADREAIVAGDRVLLFSTWNITRLFTFSALTLSVGR